MRRVNTNACPISPTRSDLSARYPRFTGWPGTFLKMANASFDADDSLLGGSSTSLMSIPDLYPPSGSTLAPPARYHPPPAIDPDLAHTDFDDTHSLLNSPNEHSRSILPGAFADGEDGEQDSFAGLDDDEIQDRLMLDIVGEDGEMSREEERASRRAKAVRDRAALIQAHVDSLSDHLRGTPRPSSYSGSWL